MIICIINIQHAHANNDHTNTTRYTHNTNNHNNATNPNTNKHKYNKTQFDKQIIQLIVSLIQSIIHNY